MRNDERLNAIKKEANSKAFGLCFIGLWLIIFYRQFILQQAPKEYSDIFLLVIGVSVYLIANIVLKGGYSQDYDQTKKNPLLNILLNLIYLAIFIAFFAFLTGIKAPVKLASAGLIFFIISKSPKLFTYFSNKINEKELED